MESEAFLNTLDTIKVSHHEGNTLQNLVSQFISTVDALKRVLPPLVPEPREDCVRIKLPDSSDYRGVVTDQETFLKAFEQLLLLDPNFR